MQLTRYRSNDHGLPANKDTRIPFPTNPSAVLALAHGQALDLDNQLLRLAQCADHVSTPSPHENLDRH